MTDEFWYDESTTTEDLPGKVMGYVQGLDSAQSLVHKLNVENARLYACRDVAGLGGPRAIGSVSFGTSTLAVTENIVTSVVQTACALIAANRPKPTFLTDGAEWSKQQHAKKLGKFVVGLYDRLNIYPLWVDAFRDACIFGTGCVKVFARNGEPRVEKVLIDDIIVDEQEARDCLPRQLHQRRYVDRAVLRREYPERAKAIAKASGADQHATGGVKSSHMIEVIESWHLPSDEDAGDGRHACCIEGACLFDEAYEKDYFPFVFYRWEKPITGFYGIGLVEPLTGLQLRLNALNRFIKKCQDTIARPDIYGDFDQRMPDKFFENGVGRFFRTRGGKPPTFYTPQALNAETYNERRYVVERAFALAGVSEMTAQAKKDPGITSGIAINAMAEKQTGRFGLQSEAFEDAHLQTAQRLIWVMKDISTDGKSKVEVEFRAKHFAQTIKWSEVDPKEDVYHIDVEASSLMSRTPGGRVQQAMDFLQIGAIDAKQFVHLADMPDLERFMDLADAAIKDIEATVECLLDGEWESPEPLQDLTEGIKRVQMAYLRARRQKAPDEVLEMLRTWMDMARSMLDEATAAAAPPPQMPMPGAPMDPMGGVVPGAALPGPGSPLPPGVM